MIIVFVVNEVYEKRLNGYSYSQRNRLFHMLGKRERKRTQNINAFRNTELSRNKCGSDDRHTE